MRIISRSVIPAVLFVIQGSLASAAAEPPPLDAYGELPRMEDAAISPDGKSIAGIMRDGSGRRIVVFDPDGTSRLNISAGDGKFRAVEWADERTVMLTNSATVPLVGFTVSMYELDGTILLPISGGGASGMVFGKSDRIAHTTRGRYGIRTIDGKTVGFFGGIALNNNGMAPQWSHGRTTLYAVDIATNRAKIIAPSAGEDHYRDWLVDAAGSVSVILDVSETTGAWRIYRAKGGDLARGVDPTGDVGLISFGKSGATVIYRIEDDGGNQRWFEVPLAGGQPQEIFGNLGLERIFVDRRSGNLIGHRLSGADRATVMDDPAHQSALTRTFRAFAGREARLVDWTPDFAKIIVRTSGGSGKDNDSGTWYFVDVANRRADPLVNERPSITPEQVGPISLIDYAARDGLEMDGVLTLPPGREARNLPVIMLPHGGPAARDKVEFDWWAQAFASRGYAVFQPNFRGSTGGTDAFRHAGDGQWGRAMQTDISDGLAELAKRGLVDPRRACIVGASYGGYAALAGVTLQQGAYRCAVSVAGVADLKLMYATDVRESGDSKMMSRSLREQLGDPRRYDEVSPRRFAARADAPVLLIHGKDDTVVPLKQSQVMADALKDAGKPYELVVLPGEDHWLSGEETRKRMLAESMRFVQKHNPAD